MLREVTKSQNRWWSLPALAILMGILFVQVHCNLQLGGGSGEKENGLFLEGKLVRFDN